MTHDFSLISNLVALVVVGRCCNNFFFFFFCTSLLLINNTGMLGEGLVKAEQRILHSVTSEMFFAHVVAEGEAF